jgi:hypothetical protein
MVRSQRIDQGSIPCGSTNLLKRSVTASQLALNEKIEGSNPSASANHKTFTELIFGECFSFDILLGVWYIYTLTTDTSIKP